VEINPETVKNQGIYPNISICSPHFASSAGKSEPYQFFRSFHECLEDARHFPGVIKSPGIILPALED